MSLPSVNVNFEAPTYSEDSEGNHAVVDFDSSVDGKHRHTSDAVLLVVMGVSGTGKSTLGAALSNALRLPFIDGDDLHPQSNVDKMSRGDPLTDADRQPWLETIRRTAVSSVLNQLGDDNGSHAEPDAMPETEKSLDERSMLGRGGQPSPVRDEDQKPGIVIACSALKGSYRSVLRGEILSEVEGWKHSGKLPTWFVYMKGSREVLMDRMMKRQGHFMKAEMLDSQLKTLESPENEKGVVTVLIEWSTEDQVREVVRALEDGAG